MGAALVTSNRTGSAGVSGLDVTWHKGQDEGHRPLLWHSIRIPAAMCLVPDSDRLAMYSGNVSTLGSRPRSSDSSDGELPATDKTNRNSERGCRPRTHRTSWPLNAGQTLEGSESVTEGISTQSCWLTQFGEPLLLETRSMGSGPSKCESTLSPTDPLGVLPQ